MYLGFHGTALQGSQWPEGDRQRCSLTVGTSRHLLDEQWTSLTLFSGVSRAFTLVFNQCDQQIRWSIQLLIQCTVTHVVLHLKHSSSDCVMSTAATMQMPYTQQCTWTHHMCKINTFHSYMLWPSLRQINNHWDINQYLSIHCFQFYPLLLIKMFSPSE